jgi:hypothetical protein
MACGLALLTACNSDGSTAAELPSPTPPVSVPAAARLRLLQVLGDSVIPGTPFVLRGEQLTPPSGEAQLWLGGVSATILEATAVQLTAVVPADRVPCGAVGLQTLRLTAGGLSDSLAVPVRSARRLALRPGQAVTLGAAAEWRCVELAAPAAADRGRYLVTVVNTSTTAAQTAAFELRGFGSGALAAQVADVRPPGAVPWVAAGAVVGSGPDTHHEVLARQVTMAKAMGASRPVWPSRAAAATGAPSAAARALRSVGDTVELRVLDRSCTAGRTVRARVVYAGARSVVYEDVTAPRAGTMDGEYERLGSEFDERQYPLLKAAIGDPLAMDAAMGGDGRVAMLFTPYVNDSLSGVAGFVSACNFHPRSTFAGSNEDELLYARVATVHEAPEQWSRSIRGTVMHEAKHLASYAERFKAGHPFEEPWLEEATARIAEELYARTYAGGGAWKGNVGFAGSVRCELVACDDRPLLMWRHFSALHGYLRGVDTLTPLGAVSANDVTFYGSGWSLVRWAADHFAGNEAAWLSALVRGGRSTGIGFLSGLTGRPVADLLVDWSLAQVADDLPGLVPERAEHTMPSWNQPDIMQGMATLYPGQFQAAPVRAHALTFGSFAVAVPRLRAFSSSHFQFEGPQGGSQLLQLSPAGASAPLRLAVLRLP